MDCISVYIIIVMKLPKIHIKKLENNQKSRYATAIRLVLIFNVCYCTYYFTQINPDKSSLPPNKATVELEEKERELLS